MTHREYNGFVDELADPIYRYIFRQIRNEDDARDVVQNAFEILWRKRDNVDPTKVKSFMYRVAYNNMIDLIRKGKRIDLPGEMIESGASVMNTYSEAGELIQKALDRLPEVQKSVILLRDYEGYSYKEISEIAGLTEAQVKVYIFRGRQALKSYLVSMEKVL